MLISCTVFSQVQRKITYHDNGNKNQLLTYCDNQLSGKCIAWNTNGVVIGKVHYNQGKRNGKWYIWHDDGTPAYQFYYRDNLKVGVWKYYDSTGNLVGQKEYKPIYERNTLISLGTFTLSDISITFQQRLDKNKPYVLGGEYQTYINDGETGTFDTFEKFSKHSIMGIAGLLSHGWGMSAKVGTYFGADYVKLDYGAEMLLIMTDETMSISPVFGISVSKGIGIQFKFGLNF